MPWLLLPADYSATNVAVERDERGSMLTLHRRLVALRRPAAALEVGQFIPLGAEGDLLIYLREGEDGRFGVALNLGPAPQTTPLPGSAAGGRVALDLPRPRRQGDRGGDRVAGR